jgi:hypothetical protein
MLDVRHNLDSAEKIFLTPEEKIALLEAKLQRAQEQVKAMAELAQLLKRQELR